MRFEIWTPGHSTPHTEDTVWLRLIAGTGDLLSVRLCAVNHRGHALSCGNLLCFMSDGHIRRVPGISGVHTELPLGGDHVLRAFGPMPGGPFGEKPPGTFTVWNPGHETEQALRVSGDFTLALQPDSSVLAENDSVIVVCLDHSGFRLTCGSICSLTPHGVEFHSSIDNSLPLQLNLLRQPSVF